MSNAARDMDLAPAIRQVAAALRRPEREVDPDGYELSITAAAIGAEGRRLAWIECRCRESGRFTDIRYHLHVRLDGTPTLKWEVETYNPYFGADVEWMAWWDDRLTFLYREKHHSYVVTWRAGTELIRKRVADEWRIHQDVLIYRSEVLDRVERLRLPDLAPLETWTAEQARIRSLLPDGYDEINEIRRRYADR